jgi:hypothetical protein
MPLQSNGLLLLSSLRDADPPNNSWFTEKSPTALAGRCLLDVLEYLRTDPKLPGRFRHVTNAHAIRLACRYLVDEHLDHKVVLDRFAHHIQDVTRRLRESRNDSPPTTAMIFGIGPPSWRLSRKFYRMFRIKFLMLRYSIRNSSCSMKRSGLRSQKG